MRLIFFGTPEFAVPTLDAVTRGHEIVAVVAQPDKPAGRGMRMQAPAVVQRARDLGLKVLQPAKIRDAAALEEIASLEPEAGVVVAYGKILPVSLLSVPARGFLNVHASLLPKYRGAAPIQRAIEAGENVTGVSIMRVDEELDHGPVLTMERMTIDPDEHAPSVSERLALLGAQAMSRVLRSLEVGPVPETPQHDAEATFAPKIEKEEGRIRWSESSRTIYNRLRAFDPWPGIFFTHDGETIKVIEMSVVDGRGEPGSIVSIEEALIVGTGSRNVALQTLQRPGKRPAAAAEVARALGWRTGTQLH
jgi:methionyl-tRNA formyltransferase